MRISELSPDHRSSSGRDPQPLPILLEELECLVRDAESLSPDDSSLPKTLAARLRLPLSRLSGPLLPLPDAAKLHLWKLAYRLWNACVDLSNASQLRTAGGRRPDLAELRQAAADLLLPAGAPSGIPSAAAKSASFFLKTGQIWHELGQLDRAARCFEIATDLASRAQIVGEEEQRLLLDLNLARSRVAWEASDRNLAIALLNRSKNLVSGSPAAFQAVAEEFLRLGKLELAKKPAEGGSDASKLLAEALDLCEKGIAAARGRTLDLEELKVKCLRFLAAERLQAEDYEGVLRCVRVLRTGASLAPAKEHPSVGYVAMSAWIGTGRMEEAERELKGLMANSEAPEAVCISAAEAFLAVAGPEVAKGVLLGLVARCRSAAGAALRIVRRVAEGGVGGGRTRVVSELVADETVVALFDCAAAATERNTMHALLWNR